MASLATSFFIYCGHLKSYQVSTLVYQIIVQHKLLIFDKIPSCMSYSILHILLVFTNLTACTYFHPAHIVLIRTHKISQRVELVCISNVFQFFVMHFLYFIKSIDKVPGLTFYLKKHFKGIVHFKISFHNKNEVLYVSIGWVNMCAKMPEHLQFFF